MEQNNFEIMWGKRVQGNLKKIDIERDEKRKERQIFEKK